MNTEYQRSWGKLQNKQKAKKIQKAVLDLKKKKKGDNTYDENGRESSTISSFLNKKNKNKWLA